MKRSETPTGHVLIVAKTDAEYDSVKFAIVTLDDMFIHKLKQRSAIINGFADDDGFFSVEFLHAPAKFFNDPDLDVDEAPEVLNGDTLCFIEVTDAGMDEFTTPTQRLSSATVKMYKDGGISFCYDSRDDSQDSFWTENISLPDIITI